MQHGLNPGKAAIGPDRRKFNNVIWFFLANSWYFCQEIDLFVVSTATILPVNALIDNAYKGTLFFVDKGDESISKFR